MDPSKKAAQEKRQVAEAAIHNRNYNTALQALREQGPIISALREPATTTTTPPPPPPPPPPSTVPPIFEADALEPKLVIQQKTSGRTLIVPPIPGFATTHDTAIQFECRPGDSLSSAEATANPPTARAEAYVDPRRNLDLMALDVPRFYRWFIHYPEDYDVRTAGFRTSGQFRPWPDDGGKIVLCFMEWINERTGKLELRFDDINGPTIAVVEPGMTLDMLVESFWSQDKTKALQRAFRNGEEIGVKHATTAGVYPKFGNYKADAIPATRKIFQGWVGGASRAAVGL